jgi:hypothetical protein
MTWFYRCAGLCIQSDLVFPRLLPLADGAPDITIRAGAVPDALPGAEKAGFLYQLKPSALLYRLPGLAQFYLQDGCEITYALDAATDPDSARALLIGIALPLLFHQRGDMTLQGCALEIDGGAVILAGCSGIGKSTLAAAFVQRGCRMLTDDYSVVRLNNAAGEALVYPTFPVLHLWRFALRQLGYSAEAVDALPRLRPQLQKHQLDTSSHFRAEPLPLRAIYIMDAPVRPTPVLEPIPAVELLPQIHWLYSFQRLAVEIGAVKRSWRLAAHMAARVRIKRLNRVERTFDCNALINAVLEDMRS